MGIQSASATFSRFFIQDIPPGDFWTYVDEKLNSGCFKELEEGLEEAAGFASWEDIFDPAFPFGSYHKGEYVAFNFRLDQRKVPGIIVKQHTRQRIQKYRDENGGKWPPRQVRQEIREDVQDWLLKRILPRPSSCEVVWNPAAKWMIVGTTGPKMLEAFLEHFEKHFKLYPIPLIHVHWGLNGIPLSGQEKDRLNSMVSVKSAHVLEEGRFLGYEFLTWAWFITENSQQVIPFGEGRQAEVHLGERLTLTLPGEGNERVVCNTRANALYEARTALRQGKMVSELQLFIRVGENEYLLALDSSLSNVKCLRTPKQLSGCDTDDVDGQFLERMFFLEEISAALNALYGRFLSERLDSGWDSRTLPLMRKWIAEGGEDSQPASIGPADRESVPF